MSATTVQTEFVSALEMNLRESSVLEVMAVLRPKGAEIAAALVGRPGQVRRYALDMAELRGLGCYATQHGTAPAGTL